MAEKVVKVWYDPEGDYLEVIFDQKTGYFLETESDRVIEKVDDEGNVLGVSIPIRLGENGKDLGTGNDYAGTTWRNYSAAEAR